MRAWVWGPQVIEQVGERGRGGEIGATEWAVTSGPNQKGKTTAATKKKEVRQDEKDRSAF